MRRLAWGSAAGGVVLAAGLTGCLRGNPAFDEYLIADGETTKSDAGESDPSGDGDSGESNSTSGDGDPTTTTNGDGDGDPTATGDGDGDPTTTTGDGDPTGDGDGDPTTGDGDGDESTTGLPVQDVLDPNDLCEQMFLPEPYDPLVVSGEFEIDLTTLPGFTMQGFGCQELFLCNATQENCNAQSAFFTKVASGQMPSPGGAPMAAALQLHFIPGNPNCGMPPLLLDPTQTLGISYTVNNIPSFVEARMPCFDGTDLRLWIAANGSTFYDQALTIPASVW